MDRDEPLRVVQWTTGRTGTAAVRGILCHPALELVGCFAHSPDKVGRDVGELCGLAPVGVLATDDVDALLALRPDCVSYMPFRPDIDHLEAILGAGIDVVTTMYMLSGDGYGPEFVARRDAAIRHGGSTLYASGIYPGHAPLVAISASAMCERIDRISVLESLDITGYANEAMFRAMGYDLAPDDPAATAACEASCGSFVDQVHTIAEALGVAVDAVEFHVELATADEDLDLGFMAIGAGRVAGFRGTVAGLHRGRSVVECRFAWKLGDRMTPNWPVTDGYLVEIEGEPGVRLTIGAIDGHLDGAITTAMPVVNAIPEVCAAPAGILNRMTLPLVRGTITAR